MHREGECSAKWCWGGMAIGLIVGSAGVARAKLQCPSDTNVGRKHAAVPISASAGGQAVPIPSLSERPALGQLVFKTEFDADPDLVHVEVFDPDAAAAARILHLSRKP
jgi:hypothetical protein